MSSMYRAEAIIVVTLMQKVLKISLYFIVTTSYILITN